VQDDGSTSNGGIVFDQVDRTMTMDVVSTNDAPTISNVTNQTTDEDTPKSNILFSIDDPDHTVICNTDVSVSSSNTSLLDEIDTTVG
jgi:hypothetical protein